MMPGSAWCQVVTTGGAARPFTLTITTTYYLKRSPLPNHQPTYLPTYPTTAQPPTYLPTYLPSHQPTYPTPHTSLPSAPTCGTSPHPPLTPLLPCPFTARQPSLPPERSPACGTYLNGSTSPYVTLLPLLPGSTRCCCCCFKTMPVLPTPTRHASEPEPEAAELDSGAPASTANKQGEASAPRAAAGAGEGEVSAPRAAAGEGAGAAAPGCPTCCSSRPLAGPHWSS